MLSPHGSYGVSYFNIRAIVFTDMLRSTWNRFRPQKAMDTTINPLETPTTVSDRFFRARGWSEHIFASCTSFRTKAENMGMSPSSALQGLGLGQYDATYARFEWIL